MTNSELGSQPPRRFFLAEDELKAQLEATEGPSGASDGKPASSGPPWTGHLKVLVPVLRVGAVASPEEPESCILVLEAHSFYLLKTGAFGKSNPWKSYILTHPLFAGGLGERLGGRGDGHRCGDQQRGGAGGRRGGRGRGLGHGRAGQGQGGRPNGLGRGGGGAQRLVESHGFLDYKTSWDKKKTILHPLTNFDDVFCVFLGLWKM